MSNTDLVFVSSEDRFLRVIAHGGTLFAWFLAPLCVYLVSRRSSPRVADEAFQALLWSGLGTILAVPTLGLSILVCLGYHVMGAYRALNDQTFDYPLVARFASRA